MTKKLIFLGSGTSQGVPVIGCNCLICNSINKKDKRLRSSVILQLGKNNILIDSGPDFRYQILKNKIKNIDAVLYTHEHRDHVAGIDDLRSFYYLNKEPINMYMSSKVLNALKKDYSYLFSDKEYFGKPKLEIEIIDKSKPFYVFNHEVIPIQVHHYKLPVLGFKFYNLAYITDANFISENELNKLKNLDVLIINCLQKKTHISHFNLEKVLEIIKILKPKKSYLTHIGHGLGLHEEVQSELPMNVFLAYDNLKIDF